MIGTKGGIGKTTLVVNLGVALASRGHRVLLMDLDSQGGLGLYFDVDRHGGIADYLMERITINRAVKRTRQERLLVMPRGHVDPRHQADYEAFLGDPVALRKLLDLLASRFDYVLLDLPSGLGGTTRAALTAARHVLIPVQAEPMAVRGVEQALSLAQYVRSTTNPDLDLLGVVPTFVDLDRKPGQEELDALWLGSCCGTAIAVPRTSEFVQGSRNRRPVQWLQPTPRDLTARFDCLALMIENRIAERDQQPRSESDADREGAPSRIARTLGRLRVYGPVGMHPGGGDPRRGSFVAASETPDENGQAEAALGRSRRQTINQLCEQGSFGFKSWNDLLDWCLFLSDASHAFVLDQQNLTIASRGQIPAADVESAGIRMVEAFAQAARAERGEAPTREVSLQLGSMWLTGINVAFGEENAFTFGVLGDHGLSPAQRAQLKDVLGVVIEHFFEPLAYDPATFDPAL
ncbi:MAG: AAA family ATPase [Planctomycetes bacterium]|nr:AAA family ATPase [Planctomycetota bacterium]